MGRRSKEKITKKCDNYFCENMITKLESEIVKHGKNYCCRECYDINRRGHVRVLPLRVKRLRQKKFVEKFNQIWGV